VGASKLLEASIEVHLAFPVKQHLDGPPPLSADVFPQVDGGWLPAGEKIRKIKRVYFPYVWFW
jgi:hypothetical protein